MSANAMMHAKGRGMGRDAAHDWARCGSQRKPRFAKARGHFHLTERKIKAAMVSEALCTLVLCANMHVRFPGVRSVVPTTVPQTRRRRRGRIRISGITEEESTSNNNNINNVNATQNRKERKKRNK